VSAIALLLWNLRGGLHPRGVLVDHQCVEKLGLRVTDVAEPADRAADVTVGLADGLGAQTGGDGKWTLTTDCNLPVAIGGTCTANVSFAPSVAASASALVDVTDNYRTPGFVRQAVQLNGVGR